MNNEIVIDSYRPFDQRRWLGDPPWSGDELIAWETAHGHDVRMKCYVEYGCQAVIPEAHEDGRREVTALVQQAIVDDVLEQTREGEACVRVETLRGLLRADFLNLYEDKENRDG